MLLLQKYFRRQLEAGVFNVNEEADHQPFMTFRQGEQRESGSGSIISKTKWQP